MGTRGESIRFKIRKNINKSTAAKAKTTRFAMLCYKIEPSVMRNCFRIHARDASRNILVFVTHFSISGEGRPPPIDLIYFLSFINLLIYIFSGQIFLSSSLSNSYLQKNPATKILFIILGWARSRIGSWLGPLYTRTLTFILIFETGSYCLKSIITKKISIIEQIR